MREIFERIDALQAEFAAVVAEAFAAEEIATASDADLMRLLEVTGGIQRSVDAVQLEATVQVRHRSEGLRDERMTTTYGCARPADLLQVALRIDRTHAGRLVKAAGFTSRAEGITDAVFLPSRYDQLRLTLNDGVIGVDGYLAAIAPIEASRRRLLPEMVVEADRQLAAFAQVLAAYLDPDGAGPTDEEASRTRGLWIGRSRHGRVPVRGELLPEVAAQLARLCDSLLNPRVEPVAQPDGVHFVDSENDDDGFAPVDERTRAQKLHDTCPFGSRRRSAASAASRACCSTTTDASSRWARRAASSMLCIDARSSRVMGAHA